MLRIGSTAPASNFVHALQFRSEFRNSNSSLRGSRYWTSPGSLTEPYVTMFREAVQARAVRFVVISNGSPIAWLNTYGQWVLGNGDYNSTTRKHQDKIRQALALLQPARTES